jgi:hypothetical protein
MGSDGAEPVTGGSPTQDGVPLAIYTDPAFQSSSALVDWGDGSAAVTVGVSHVAQLAEILANHVYTMAGLYAVKTLVYGGGGLVGATVSVVDAIDQLTQVGPRVVPGNSAYWYKFTLPPNTQPGDINKDSDSAITVANAKALQTRITTDAKTGVAESYQALVQFANDKPVDATITLKDWQKNVASTDTITVHVVQVVVNDLAQGSFTPSQALTTGTQQGWDSHTVTFTAPALVPDQDVHTLTIKSRQGNTPALRWSAEVTLNGPDGNKYLDAIHVGFHQTIDRTVERSLDATTFINDSLEGNTYLDGGPPFSRPWLDGAPRDNINGSNVKAGTPTTITDNDSPDFVPVIEYDGGHHFKAISVQLTFTADLSVAAQTKDSGGWIVYQPIAHVFQEAYAAWAVNADGTITITGTGKSAIGTWTPDKTSAGVNPPKGNAWVLDIAPPTSDQGLLTSGLLANEAGKPPNLTFAHYLRP